MKSFSQNIEELELMASTRVLMNASDYKVLDVSINQAISNLNVLTISASNPYTTEAHEYSQRLHAVQSKLGERRSRWNAETLAAIINKFDNASQITTDDDCDTHSEIKSEYGWNTRGQSKTGRDWGTEQATDTDHSGASVWEVPIASFTSKNRQWHQTALNPDLSLAFDTRDHGRLSVMTGMFRMFEVAAHDIPTPFVAVSEMLDHPRIRLIPVVPKFDLNSDVYDIKLSDIEIARLLIDKLLGMGCTVIQRPQGMRALEVGPATTVGEMATQITKYCKDSHHWFP